MCMICRSLFVLLYFIFWPLCCLFVFDIQILITPLVSLLFLLPNPGLGFPLSHVVVFFMFNELRGMRFVRFVDIGGIWYHQCFNCLLGIAYYYLANRILLHQFDLTLLEGLFPFFLYFIIRSTRATSLLHATSRQILPYRDMHIVLSGKYYCSLRMCHKRVSSIKSVFDCVSLMCTYLEFAYLLQGLFLITRRMIWEGGNMFLHKQFFF